jgi:ribosomal protein S15P/S13E
MLQGQSKRADTGEGEENLEFLTERLDRLEDELKQLKQQSNYHHTVLP